MLTSLGILAATLTAEFVLWRLQSIHQVKASRATSRNVRRVR